MGTLFHSMHNYDLSPSSIRAMALLMERTGLAKLDSDVSGALLYTNDSI